MTNISKRSAASKRAWRTRKRMKITRYGHLQYANDLAADYLAFKTFRRKTINKLTTQGYYKLFVLPCPDYGARRRETGL